MSAWTAADWLEPLSGLVVLSVGAALVEHWHARQWLRRQRKQRDI